MNVEKLYKKTVANVQQRFCNKARQPEEVIAECIVVWSFNDWNDSIKQDNANWNFCSILQSNFSEKAMLISIFWKINYHRCA